MRRILVLLAIMNLQVLTIRIYQVDEIVFSSTAPWRNESPNQDKTKRGRKEILQDLFKQPWRPCGGGGPCWKCEEQNYGPTGCPIIIARSINFRYDSGSVNDYGTTCTYGIRTMWLIMKSRVTIALSKLIIASIIVMPQNLNINVYINDIFSVH